MDPRDVTAPRNPLPLLPLTCACVALAGCTALPDHPVQRALYVDLRKAVELSDDTGWVIDRLEVEGNAEHAMNSACRVDPAMRDDLEVWLSGQIALAGGPAAERYRNNGRDLAAVEDTLALERTRELLRYANANAPTDCPFWLERDDDFDGVQGDAGRFVVLGETFGYGAGIVEGGDVGLAGGGAGRVLFGHGVGSRLTIALGLEIGGVGTFQDVDGTRSIEPTFGGAVPLLVRFTRFSRIFDAEIAPVVRLNAQDEPLAPGVRVMFGGGLSTLRSSAFMPYGLLALGYQFQPPDRGEAASHALLFATRVGIDWDP